MTRICTVVNFHNLHSLLGQFGNLVFEKIVFQRDAKGN